MHPKPLPEAARAEMSERRPADRVVQSRARRATGRWQPSCGGRSRWKCESARAVRRGSGWSRHHKYLPSYLLLAGPAEEAFHVLFAVDVEGDNFRVVNAATAPSMSSKTACSGGWMRSWQESNKRRARDHSLRCVRRGDVSPNRRIQLA